MWKERFSTEDCVIWMTILFAESVAKKCCILFIVRACLSSFIGRDENNLRHKRLAILGLNECPNVSVIQLQCSWSGGYYFGNGFVFLSESAAGHELLSGSWKRRKKTHLDMTSFVLLIMRCFRWVSFARSYSSYVFFMKQSKIKLQNKAKQTDDAELRSERGSKTEEKTV